MGENDSDVGAVVPLHREPVPVSHAVQPREEDSHGTLPEDLDIPDAPAQRRDWAWVEEWRANSERTPWAQGITIALFCALLAAAAIVVLCAGLAGRLWLVVVVNLLVGAGLLPALWLSIRMPVLRWIAGGVAVGMVLGWIAAILVGAPG